jgi:hypothetical protein
MCWMTRCAVLLEPCFGNSFFSKMSQVFIDSVNSELMVFPKNTVPTVLRPDIAHHTPVLTARRGVPWAAWDFPSTICKYYGSSHKVDHPLHEKKSRLTREGHPPTFPGTTHSNDVVSRSSVSTTAEHHGLCTERTATSSLFCYKYCTTFQFVVQLSAMTCTHSLTNLRCRGHCTNKHVRYVHISCLPKLFHTLPHHTTCWCWTSKSIPLGYFKGFCFEVMLHEEHKLLCTEHHYTLPFTKMALYL